ncbi:MAG: hypothetical protein M3P50_07370, partial [Actinomycetota bacterium]|nr:hypothetical protein [Actinomycetota bacterium]
MSNLLQRLTPATVLASLAAFAALSGGAYAGKKITSRDISRGAVTSRAIKDGTITARDISRRTRTSLGRGARGRTGATGPAGPAG